MMMHFFVVNQLLTDTLLSLHLVNSILLMNEGLIMPKNSMMCSDVMKLKMMIIATLALGAIASQHAQAHDQWAVGISIGNPYPPAVAYYPSVPYHPAQRNFFYGPQVFGPPVDLGPTTYIYRAPRVVYGPVIAQPYIGQPYVAQPFIGRSFGGRHDGYRGNYRGHHRGRHDR
jgi:hypothetical protein